AGREDGRGNGGPRRSAEPLAAEDGDRGGPGGAEEAAPIEQAFRRRRNRKGVIAAHHRHSSRCSSACDRGARPVARTARTSVGGGTIRWFRVRTVVLPNANRSSGCARRRSSTSSRVP